MVNSGLRRGKLGPLKGPQKVGCYPCGGHLRAPLRHGHGQGMAVLRQAFLASKGSSFWKPSPVNSLVPTFTSSKPAPPPAALSFPFPTTAPSFPPPMPPPLLLCLNPRKKLPSLQKACIKAELDVGPPRWG